ncbi:MAG: ATP-binding protein [Kangiellaceae bacterium]|nr:ATP-binding protein [Kangiellaceae bacterium]
MVVRNITFNSKSTFKRQLLGFFIFSAFVLALTTSIITAWQTSREVEQSTIDNGLQVTSNFADQAVLALLTGSEDNAVEAVQRALGFNPVDGVAVYKADGDVLITSAKSEQIQFYFDLDKIKQEATLVEDLNDYWVFSAPVYFVDEEDDPELVEPDEGETDKQLLGYVLVEYNKQELRQIQNSIFINNVSIGAILTAILAILMGWGIKRLTAPLSHLSQTMETARDSGDYLLAEIHGANEIRQMAAVYNQMMSRLAKQRAELEKHRANLEAEVEIRTQELKVARDSALTASRHKSEFLANISHELRTPLQAVIGYVDLVKEDLELECLDPQAEDLGKAIRSAHILLGLINNILDLAKIEAGKMDLYIQAVDTDYLVNDTMETILPMATANGNELKLNKGSLSRTLNLDRQKIMQVFLNLLSNACKFTKNGKVEFSIENDDRYLRFSVSDTGVGIPKDKLDFIFEQFTQVDGSQSRKFEGTGLGMAITQNFCQMMDAEIKVDSVEGEGTCFSVKMPLQKLYQQETETVDS